MDRLKMPLLKPSFGFNIRLFLPLCSSIGILASILRWALYFLESVGDSCVITEAGPGTWDEEKGTGSGRNRTSYSMSGLEAV